MRLSGASRTLEERLKEALGSLRAGDGVKVNVDNAAKVRAGGGVRVNVVKVGPGPMSGPLPFPVSLLASSSALCMLHIYQLYCQNMGPGPG